ncbi:hypothetical protein D3C75_991350 [compost metagenome]
MRATSRSMASALAESPAWARRWRIHCGSCAASTGQICTNWQLSPSISALAHLVFCVLPSSRGRLSSSTVSSAGRAR